jgi:hypothetical protein
MKPIRLHLMAIFAGSVAIAAGFSISAVAQAQCPFYLPDCTVAPDLTTTQEEPETNNITAIINTASISTREQGTHLDLLTQQVNGTSVQISEELIGQVNDVERDETQLFVVDRAGNETRMAEDFDELEQILRDKVRDYAVDAGSGDVLNVSIIQLVNSTSSNLTVDMRVTNSSSVGDYQPFAACWLGHWVSSGFNATMAERNVCTG